MTSADIDSIAHLADHHGDFKHFADLMVKTHAGRFGGTFWAFIEQHTSLADTGGLVVDLGTGPGLLLRDLTTRYDNTSAVGVELQPEMLKVASEVVAEDAVRRRLVEVCLEEAVRRLRVGCLPMYVDRSSLLVGHYGSLDVRGSSDGLWPLDAVRGLRIAYMSHE